MSYDSVRRDRLRANMELAAAAWSWARSATCRLSTAPPACSRSSQAASPTSSSRPEHIVVMSLETGDVIDGDLRPSSDTPTHLELYRAFGCGAIVHTHSEFATMLAQARVPIRCMGTTHADYFRGDIPVTRPMRREEVEQDYEKNTGLVIVETFRPPAVARGGAGRPRRQPRPVRVGARCGQGGRERARPRVPGAARMARPHDRARRAEPPDSSSSTSTTCASTGRRRITDRSEQRSPAPTAGY